METEWLNSDDIALILGVKKKRVCVLARQGRIKGVKFQRTDNRNRGTEWHFTPAAFAEFLATGGNDRRLVPTMPITATREDIIWFAGFFDGEGCVSIQTRAQLGGGWHLSLAIPNTAQKLLYTLPALFGGSCHKTRFQSHQKQQQSRWRASGRQAGHILVVLLPFLRVKQRQAALGLEFQERIDRGNHNGNRPMSPEERAWRDEAAARMKWLNHHYE